MCKRPAYPSFLDLLEERINEPQHRIVNRRWPPRRHLRAQYQTSGQPQQAPVKGD